MGKNKSKAAQIFDESPSPNQIEDIAPDAEPDLASASEPGIAKWVQERDELMDQLLRKQAEFDNYRKRVVRDRAESRLAAQEEVLKEILPILDSCEMGLMSFRQAAEEGCLQTYQEGYELFLKSLQVLLARFGVSPVPGVGEAFDPAYHEAVLREESDKFKDGEVIDEFRRGYVLQGRLLRPSQVRVAVKPEEPSSS